jgi:hypothetical protein
MEHFAVFVNDEASTRRIVEPLLAGGATANGWTVVMCPPQMTHRISKWLSERQRRQWRHKWSTELQSQLAPLFARVPAEQLHWMPAAPRVAQTTLALRRRYGSSLHLLDVRRRHTGQHLPDIEPRVEPDVTEGWKAPVAVGSTVSLVLALID